MIGFFLFFVSTFVSASLIFYKLTAGVLLLCVFAAALTSLLAVRYHRPAQIIESAEFEPPLKKNIFTLVLFGILSAVAVALLLLHRSREVLETPWQSISPFYLPVFFLLTLTVGVILLSRYQTKTVLFVLIAFSCVQHLYLPLSHTLPWGGDVWRHIAVEKRLINGEFYPPVLFGSEAKYRTVTLPTLFQHTSFNGNLHIPEVFLIPQKYSYGQLWGATVLFAKFTGLSLETVNIWLIPILWSLAIPLLLFRIGTLLFQSRRMGLLLAFLAALPFPFQALGGLTLPNSLGYITFFYVFMMWLEYLRDGKKAQRNLSLVLAMLMVFGYTLHFVLIWVVILATVAIKWISRLHNQLLCRSLATVGFFASVFAIPCIELVLKVSVVPDVLTVQWKQMLGQFSGWYFAHSPTDGGALSGNFLFNHLTSSTFVHSFFLDWRWWVIPVMLCIWSVVFVGVSRMITHVVSEIEMLMTVLFTTTFGGYLIGWYVLSGDRLLTRRLDGMVAFLILVFFVYGIRQLNVWQKTRNKQQLLITHCLLLSLFAFFQT